MRAQVLLFLLVVVLAIAVIGRFGVLSSSSFCFVLPLTASENLHFLVLTLVPILAWNKTETNKVRQLCQERMWQLPCCSCHSKGQQGLQGQR